MTRVSQSILLIAYCTLPTVFGLFRDVFTLKRFLHDVYEPKLAEICTMRALSELAFSSNKSDQRANDIMIKQMVSEGDFVKNAWTHYFRTLHPDDFEDIEVRRKLKRLVIAGNQALEQKKMERLSHIINAMSGIGHLTKICPYDLPVCDPLVSGLNQNDVEEKMGNATDFDELLYYWKRWHDTVGQNVKLYYSEYVALSNEAACMNNFTDKGAVWRYVYDTPDFENFVDKLWEQVRPLYDQLQMFVYRRLKKVHNGRDFNDLDMLIPAHLLGNMYAQKWTKIAPLVAPYPNVTMVDGTKELRDRNYTVLKMFEVADEFYQSLGYESIESAYTGGTFIEEPKDRPVMCQPAAWDFCNGKDFKITFCGRLTFDHFVSIHHEMGHIHYYRMYKNQPLLFRAGANPAFHEAIGDTIALSVSTPRHLQKIGLLEGYVETEESEMNALMLMALDKVAFAPFSYMIDKWRWSIFSGNTTFLHWNEYYWNLSQTHQRVKAPIDRSEAVDFDGGVKFHVATDAQYISYFLANMLQFQIHRGLCIAAGQYQPGNEKLPFHKCDIYNSKAAGAKLREALSLGYSKPWPEVLEILTGERELSGNAMLEYFEPLMKFLTRRNKEEL